MRKVRIAFLVIISLLAGWQVVQAQSSDVLVLDIEGPLTPAMVSYFERGIETAEATNATAVLIQIDTPGGSGGLMQEIVQLFRNADVPIIIYVGPSGAQAASAGAIITMAAHAAGMAPETTIGAASPVSGEGGDLDETLFQKITEDIKAQVRSLTQRRGEEATTLAEAMIDDARAVNAREALEVGLIDAVATDLPDLLEQLDGLTIVIDETETTLATADAVQQPYAMSTLERVLHALANPTLIGILLAIAVPAILIELQSPGGWVAGFIGVLSIALAMYGLGQLPVNWLGLALVVGAFILFVAEVFATNHGALGVTGAVLLLAGLLVLFNSPGTPEFARISIPAAVGISVITAGFFIFLATMALRAQRAQPSTGMEGLVGKKGPVRAALESKMEEGPYTGMVLVNGELWRAEAVEPIAADDVVTVTAVEGFTLQVKRSSS